MLVTRHHRCGRDRTGCADKPGRFVDNEDAHILVLCAQRSHVVLATTCVRVVGYVDDGRETSPKGIHISSCEFQVPDELWGLMPGYHSPDALAKVNMKS